MYLYRNNFANIGNNGAVVPENFFSGQAFYFQDYLLSLFRLDFAIY